MKTKHPPFVPIKQLYRQLAETLAAIIEHEDCSDRLYLCLTRTLADWENDYGQPVTPRREARAIRARLPRLLTEIEAPAWLPEKNE